MSRTSAQQAASMRNWGIRALRALHASCIQMSPARRDAAQAIIDEELVARGALATPDYRKALAEDWRKRVDKEEDQEVPF
jgi:hypothetical protein